MTKTVSIPITFTVTSEVDDDDLTQQRAEEAAETAARDFLAFVKVSGQSTDCDEVEVHVEGFGECTVSIEDES